MARLVIVYFILMGCALFILMLDTPYDTALLVATECLLAAAFAVNAALVRKIYDFKGFALRNKDISYRSGIFSSRLLRSRSTRSSRSAPA